MDGAEQPPGHVLPARHPILLHLRQRKRIRRPELGNYRRKQERVQHLAHDRDAQGEEDRFLHVLRRKPVGGAERALGGARDLLLLPPHVGRLGVPPSRKLYYSLECPRALEVPNLHARFSN